MSRVSGRVWAAIAAIALAGGAVWALWPAAMADFRGLLLLDSLSSRRVRAFQGYIFGPVSRTEVSIPSSPEPIRGHLYRRVRGSAGERGVVLIHGFSPIGDEYDSLIEAAQNLASSGLVVFTPVIPPLTHYTVNEEDVRTIGSSTEWLAKQTGSPVTAIGISFSGGLVFSAAADPEFRPGFRQIVVLSGYDDLKRITRFYVTGLEARPDGGDEYRAGPDDAAVRIAALHFLDRLVPREDVAGVRSLIELALYYDPKDPMRAAKLAAPTPRQKQEATEIFEGGPEILAKITAEMNAPGTDLAALSPHTLLPSLDLPVTVISGMEDPAIPPTESRWLARDIPPRDVCRVYFSPLIEHVEFPNSEPKTNAEYLKRWRQKWALVHALAPAMETADPHLFFPGCTR